MLAFWDEATESWFVFHTLFHTTFCCMTVRCVYTLHNDEGDAPMKTAFSLFAAALSAIIALVLASCSAFYDMEPVAGSATSSEGTQTSTPEATTSSSSLLRVTFVDVGKGDCILLQSGNSAVLVDTGHESTADDVLSCLQARGVGHLYRRLGQKGQAPMATNGRHRPLKYATRMSFMKW